MATITASLTTDSRGLTRTTDRTAENRVDLNASIGKRAVQVVIESTGAVHVWIDGISELHSIPRG